MYQRKTSTCLTARQGEQLLLAIAHSASIGRLLNSELTIHCVALGLDGPLIQRFVTKLMKLIGDWMWHHCGHPSHHIWILENPLDGRLNLHILIYVPKPLWKAFMRHMRSWVRLAGGIPVTGAIEQKRIWFADTDSDQFLEDGISGVFRYLLKGLDPMVCPDWNITHKPQGVIVGRRCGYSRSLSPRHRLPGSVPHPHFPGVRLLSQQARWDRIFFNTVKWPYDIEDLGIGEKSNPTQL